jgi:hypothetical protein
MSGRSSSVNAEIDKRNKHFCFHQCTQSLESPPRSRRGMHCCWLQRIASKKRQYLKFAILRNFSSPGWRPEAIY